jgi:hypothetical protein
VTCPCLPTLLISTVPYIPITVVVFSPLPSLLPPALPLCTSLPLPRPPSYLPPSLLLLTHSSLTLSLSCSLISPHRLIPDHGYSLRLRSAAAYFLPLIRRAPATRLSASYHSTLTPAVADISNFTTVAIILRLLSHPHSHSHCHCPSHLDHSLHGGCHPPSFTVSLALIFLSVSLLMALPSFTCHISP